MNFFANPLSIVFLFLFVYFIESLASTLNLKTSREPLPAILKDMQTKEEQEKATRYLKVRVELGLIRDGFFLAVFFVLLFAGFFSSLQNFALTHFESVLAQSLVFAGALGLGQALLNIPFSFYSTFKIEAEYGFNRTTVSTFIGDLIKGAILAIVLGGALFSFVVTLLTHFGSHAWLAIWLGYTAFQFLIVWIAPITILPLFLKLTPLVDGPLKTAIESYSKKQHFKLDGAWVCDASKRSAKGNAFFTGFGKFRRLVLFDTLIEKHTESEIVAIVAHEAGHFKLGHIWKMSVFSTFSSFVFFFLIQKFIETTSLYQAFGVSNENLGIGLVLAVIVLNKILFFASPIQSYFSRRNEFAADHFSVSTNGDAESLISGLKRLVTDNLATLQHHPLYVILHDSHPPLPDRIQPLLRTL